MRNSLIISVIIVVGISLSIFFVVSKNRQKTHNTAVLPAAYYVKNAYMHRNYTGHGGTAFVNRMPELAAPTMMEHKQSKVNIPVAASRNVMVNHAYSKAAKVLYQSSNSEMSSYGSGANSYNVISFASGNMRSDNRSVYHNSLIAPNVSHTLSAVNISRQNYARQTKTTDSEYLALRATGRPDDSQIGYLDDPVPIGGCPIELLVVFLAISILCIRSKNNPQN